jgi:hypothetical protein
VRKIVKRTMGHVVGHRVVMMTVGTMRKPSLGNVRAITGVFLNVYAIFTFVEFLQPRRCMIWVY